MENFPKWRKILIAICVVFAIIIAFVTGILSIEVLDSCDRSYSECGDYTLVYDRQKALLTRYLFYIGIALSSILFFISSRELGNSNHMAKILCRIIRVYFALSIIVAFLGVRLYPAVDLVQYSHTFIGFFPCFLGFLITIFLYSILNSYLSKKSNIENKPYSLFPNWVVKLYGLKSNLSKRVFGLFILYPVYYLVPIPVAGLFILGFYILPTSFFILLLSGVVRIIRWIVEGWRMDKNEK